MFRKLLLLICLAFVVIGFAYPCVILPVGSYTSKLGNITTSYKFAADGTMQIEIKNKEKQDSQENQGKIDAFYKLKGNKVIISLDEKFDDNDLTLQINSFYNLQGGFQNISAMVIAGGVGLLALILIVTIPRKRKYKNKEKWDNY